MLYNDFMSRKDFEIPIPLRQRSLSSVKVFADREDFLMNKPHINSYLEIGVLAGDYTDLVLKHLKPKDVTLVDTFECHDANQLNNQRFNKDSHYNFILNKYKDNKFNIIKERFDPNHIHVKMLNKKYDYIYIDADHSKNFMMDVIKFATNNLNKNGIIGINDYMIFDHFDDEYYGTVQAVNTFLFQDTRWAIKSYVIGAVLHSDVYIGRIDDSTTLY